MSIWISAVIGAIILYILYIPLPAENAIDRIKVHVFELVLRIIYFYPTNFFKIFGLHWQVWWARKSLGTLSRVLRYRLWIRPHDGVRVSKTTFDGVPVFVYEPSQRQSNGALVLIHGGGFVLMDAEGYEQLARRLAASTGATVFNIDYRKAPEHVFPTALDDCEAAISHLLNEAHERYSIDPRRVAVIGDSAGGNLAVGSIFRLLDSSDSPKPKLQVLLYPWMQLIDFQTPSYVEATAFYGGSALADPDSLARWATSYLGLSVAESDFLLRNEHRRNEAIEQHAPFLLQDMRREDLPFNSSGKLKRSAELALLPFPQSSNKLEHQERSIEDLQNRLEPLLFNPELSPMTRRDLSLSPKTLLITCEYDPLRDEGFWYANRLKKAGVDVKWSHYENAFHAVVNMHDELRLADRMLGEIVSFISDNL